MDDKAVVLNAPKTTKSNGTKAKKEEHKKPIEEAEGKKKSSELNASKTKPIESSLQPVNESKAV